MPKKIYPKKKCVEERKFNATKPKKDSKHLVEKDGNYSGILSRTDYYIYKHGGRPWMEETGYYDDKEQIEKGVRSQSSVSTDNKKELIEELKEELKGKNLNVDTTLSKEKLRELLIKERIPKYMFKFKNKDMGDVLNFTPSKRPYFHQAHHILACEVFLSDDWTTKRLDIVLQCGYNINNKCNIIYLPMEFDRCIYHELPSHSSEQHTDYNDKVCDYTEKIINKVDKILEEEEDCEIKEKLMEDLFKFFIKIEDILYKFLLDPKKKGPRGLMRGKPAIGK